MIRKLEETNLDAVMQIWLDTNIKGYNFIPAEYWSDNYEKVKYLLSKVEAYAYEDERIDENTNEAEFIKSWCNDR